MLYYSYYYNEYKTNYIFQLQEPVPWRHLLTSLPIWMNVLAQWGGVWGLFTLMTHAPTYFKVIHGWNIRAVSTELVITWKKSSQIVARYLNTLQTGWLSGMPHFMRMVVAYAVSQAGDYLLRANLLSRSNVRKLATAICKSVYNTYFYIFVSLLVQYYSNEYTYCSYYYTESIWSRLTIL